jgi:hypothetical protein
MGLIVDIPGQLRYRSRRQRKKALEIGTGQDGRQFGVSAGCRGGREGQCEGDVAGKSELMEVRMDELEKVQIG